MKTLTVRLPESLADAIEAESRERSVSKSDVIRERLQSAPGLMDETLRTRETLEKILQSSWNATKSTERPHFGSRKKEKLAQIIRAKKLRH